MEVAGSFPGWRNPSFPIGDDMCAFASDAERTQNMLELQQPAGTLDLTILTQYQSQFAMTLA